MRYKEITEELKNTISTLYETEDTYSIGRKYNIVPSTIRRILIDKGIERRHKGHKIKLHKYKEGISSLYEQGLSTVYLSHFYNCSISTIKNILLENKVYIRTNTEARRRTTIDETVFDAINEESAYWLGFLMADGGVVNNRHTTQIVVSLHKKDEKHIEKFKSFLKSNVTTSTIKGKYKRVSITSEIIANKLSEYGIVPRKSLTAKVSENLAFNRHFWRGVVDGDGCLCISSRGGIILNLVGSFDLLTQFFEYCKTIVDVGKTNIVKHKGIFSISFSYRKAYTLAKVLYSDCTVFLDRKKEKANIFEKRYFK